MTTEQGKPEGEQSASAAQDNQTQSAAASAEQKTAKPEKAEKKERARASEQPKGTVKYKTTEKHTIPFDVMVKGENILGTWNHQTGIVEFDVPAELVEGFEKHHHFQVGNVVKAE